MSVHPTALKLGLRLPLFPFVEIGHEVPIAMPQRHPTPIRILIRKEGILAGILEELEPTLSTASMISGTR